MSEGWKAYWPIFERLEGEFCDLSFSVALCDSHLGVHSARLSDLLVRSCTECENVGKSLCAEKGLVPSGTAVPKLNFPSVADAIASRIPRVNTKELVIIWPYQSLTKTTLTPFDTWRPSGSKNPDWFNAYNGVKHDRIGNAQKANVKNVIHALGALFILDLWLREQDVTQHSEHFNLAKRRVTSYSQLFSPEKFLKTTDGNLRNLVFDWT